MLYLHVTNHVKIDTRVAVNHKKFAGFVNTFYMFRSY
jgi:hypothetical protein